MARKAKLRHTLNHKCGFLIGIIVPYVCSLFTHHLFSSKTSFPVDVTLKKFKSPDTILNCNILYINETWLEPNTHRSQELRTFETTDAVIMTIEFNKLK